MFAFYSMHFCLLRFDSAALILLYVCVCVSQMWKSYLQIFTKCSTLKYYHFALLSVHWLWVSTILPSIYIFTHGSFAIFMCMRERCEMLHLYVNVYCCVLEAIFFSPNILESVQLVHASINCHNFTLTSLSEVIWFNENITTISIYTLFHRLRCFHRIAGGTTVKYSSTIEQQCA